MRTLALLIVSVLSVAAMADITLPGPLAENGLPQYPVNGQLFRRDPQRDYFWPVEAHQIVADNLYLVWQLKYQTYNWVTGSDRRPLLVGSKVLGKRLGLGPRSEKNWFRLNDKDGLFWKKVTDRMPPYVIRNDPREGFLISEMPPSGWQTWGGDLDPAEDPLGCSLTASPVSTKLGNEVVLAMTTTGSVAQATIDGNAVSRRGGEWKVTPSKAGMFRGNGLVKDDDGNVAQCGADYQIEEPKELERERCEITLEPMRIKVGQSSVIKYQSFGKATEGTLNGAGVTLPMITTLQTGEKVGRQPMLGSVKGPAGYSTCWAELEVIP